MRIFIATHKLTPFPVDDPGYIPIQNGRSLSEPVPGTIGDDTGKNISGKMPTFSEWCALYWMVENTDDSYIGLAHYRRYFRAVTHSTQVDGVAVAATNDFPEIEGDVDLVIAEPMFFGGMSIEEQYAVAHHERDLGIARQAVRKLYPDYTQVFDRTMDEGNLTPYNLFAGKRSIFLAFSRWVFDVLFLLERWIPYESYDPYQRRVFAFLSERLLTVWLRRNESRWRIVTRPVVIMPY